jgi:hypothetical protein
MRDGYTRIVIWRAATLVCVVVIAALTSTSDDWQPVTLVVALTGLAVVADTVPVAARRLRLSGGLMVQVVAMAMLGPAPAVAVTTGSGSTPARRAVPCRQATSASPWSAGVSRMRAACSTS